MTSTDQGRAAQSDRRSVLLSGLAGAGLAAGAAVATAVGGWPVRAGERAAASAAPASTGADAVARAFRGTHQAGILEAPPAHATFVALDLADGADADTVRRLLTVWTDDVERLMAGRGTLTDLEPELAAVTAALTVTVGVGRRLVEVVGAEVPAWLAPLPALRDRPPRAPVEWR